jgi:hypothetical protein
MPDDVEVGRPNHEVYLDWYRDRFGDDLNDGRAEQLYEQVTVKGVNDLQGSRFWTELQDNLPVWNAIFKAEHDGYDLLAPDQPKIIGAKSFESSVNKAFRWNVLNNDEWDRPPPRRPSTAPESIEVDPEDVRYWYGPHNWIQDFPDVFRIRLVSMYFDGVRFLAERVRGLAETTTDHPPELRYIASLDGYHAAHIWVYHTLTVLDYDSRDFVPVQLRLEIQVTTTIQAAIVQMLHRVYEDWRVNGVPDSWEWDYENPAFSVNYLGSTLHYLEGMIVVARQQGG